MRKRTKIVWLVVICFLALLILRLIFVAPDLLTFFALQAESRRTAGTWEDDPKNWSRAFNEQTPAEVQVIHSKYWKSDHFTYEYIYHFEISATPEWEKAFLQNRNLELISPAKARDFRPTQTNIVPHWFVPGPFDNYEAWDTPGGYGSIWINKTNGHIFFWEAQL